MVIREISREECHRVLAGARLARLACAHENQPYVVPVYLAYVQTSSGEEYLYGFTTPGQKVAWMRANPLVCVEADEVAALDQWVSVIATGRYEELPGTPGKNGVQGRTPERSDSRPQECDDEGKRAWQILKTHPMWEEPGWTAWAARSQRDSAEPLIPIFYRIRIDAINGHEATRDAAVTTAPVVPVPPGTGAGRV
jgi:nitroimidazol reductase NimA-like FMN-containing flavoprotein (pyridoxamine 5'-phosphate oxidase superfamily)